VLFRSISETGFDKTQFMISPNVGEEMRPLAKIASGGELSRVVLALKAILAGVNSVETVVFDEVDAGIGGRIAEMVGKKIKDLSGLHQIICITHLPQIAKYADHHYKIEKTVAGGRTRTEIRPLSGDEGSTNWPGCSVALKSRTKPWNMQKRCLWMEWLRFEGYIDSVKNLPLTCFMTLYGLNTPSFTGIHQVIPKIRVLATVLRGENPAFLAMGTAMASSRG
jgi:hypothetical protein